MKKEFPSTAIKYGDMYQPVIDQEKYNGYQFSIPFLVYYLTKFHPDEYPSISKVIGLLPVDKLNYLSLCRQTIDYISHILNISHM